MAMHPLPLPLWESPRQQGHAPGADNALFCGIVAFLPPLRGPRLQRPGLSRSPLGLPPFFFYPIEQHHNATK